MASSDYRLCDKCGAKAFYDANMNYEWCEDLPEGETFTPFRNNGEESNVQLGYLGAWSVLCTDCAQTHDTIVVLRRLADELRRRGVDSKDAWPAPPSTPEESPT